MNKTNKAKIQQLKDIKTKEEEKHGMKILLICTLLLLCCVLIFIAIVITPQGITSTIGNLPVPLWLKSIIIVMIIIIAILTSVFVFGGLA